MKTRLFLFALIAMAFGLAAQAQAQTQEIKFTNKWQNYSKTSTSAHIYCTTPVTVQFSVNASWYSNSPGSNYVFNLNGTTINVTYDNPSSGGLYNINLKAGMNNFQINYTGPLNIASYGLISIIRVNGYPIVSNDDTKLAGGPWG